MKSIIVVNTFGVAVTGSINWLLIDWTRTALMKAQEGLLPLPAFTNAIFKLQPRLPHSPGRCVFAAECDK